MPVNLISPTSLTLTGNSTEFIWNSTDGSYCWDNYIIVSDSSGNVISESGRFNPRGGDSQFTVTGYENLGSISATISCNPTNFTVDTFVTVSDSNDGIPVVDPETGELTMQVSVILDDGIPPELRDELISFTFSMFALAIGVAFILKIMR